MHLNVDARERKSMSVFTSTGCQGGMRGIATGPGAARPRKIRSRGVGEYRRFGLLVALRCAVRNGAARKRISGRRPHDCEGWSHEQAERCGRRPADGRRSVRLSGTAARRSQALWDVVRMGSHMGARGHRGYGVPYAHRAADMGGAWTRCTRWVRSRGGRGDRDRVTAGGSRARDRCGGEVLERAVRKSAGFGGGFRRCDRALEKAPVPPPPPGVTPPPRVGGGGVYSNFGPPQHVWDRPSR